MSTLFLSDIHFGDGGPSDDFGNKDDKLVNLLLWAYQVNPETRVVLCGDCLDLRETTLDKIMKAHKEAITILFARVSVFVVGNHDDSALGKTILGVEGIGPIAYKGIYVSHGSQLDWFERFFPWAGRLASRACAWGEKNIHPDIDDWALGLLGLAGKTGRSAQNARYDTKIAEAAIKHDCHSAIYGHTHEPYLTPVKVNGINIYNTGSWVGESFDYLLLDI